MTSATDELRRLLDERGVEYQLDHGYREFFWDFGESGKARASAIGTKGLVQMIVTGITPEQAIDATLGLGTCEVEYVSDWMGWHCKACDMLWQGLRDQRPRYCPNCGAKVMDA